MASQVIACMLARIDLALEQARDCIKGETPEDVTPSEAEDDTFSKIREALEDVAALSRLAAKPADGVREAHLNAIELPDVLTPPAIDQLFARDDLYTARAVFARLRSFGFSLVRAAPVLPPDGAGKQYTIENDVMKRERVYLPWLRASITISAHSIDDPSKEWIEAANNWQRRAEAAERQLAGVAPNEFAMRDLVAAPPVKADREAITMIPPTPTDATRW
ncbi:hypothetical protein [uncultured Bradyrhizobium sp.]|uniref:hypothetical protein n=1 Tax=uncultured Bradyrhizobium sp. TaxID=199684 RepID=UPI0035CB9B42